MKTIHAEQIVSEVSKLWREANFYLNEDIIGVLKNSLKKEKNIRAKDALRVILKNAGLARKENRPICQDTGFPLVFLEVGQDVNIKGDLHKSVNQGIREGTKEGFLRPSVVDCPFNRKNTGDNTPAVIHCEIVPGDKVKIFVAAKGAGSENCSKTAMLLPTAGEKEIEDFAVESVKIAGSNPCPPIIVGLGIGGTLEKAVLLSKKALLRPLNKKNPDRNLNRLEVKLLQKINKLGIGPNGFGGKTTALGVRIERFPCHLASLPIAINISCHVNRHKETVI
ncbi:MAG: fumarate hydratase [bacterium]